MVFGDVREKLLLSRTEMRKRWPRSVQVSSGGDLCGQGPERDG